MSPTPRVEAQGAVGHSPGDTNKTPSHGHRPHHLKYGDIDTGSFRPSCDEPVDGDASPANDGSEERITRKASHHHGNEEDHRLRVHELLDAEARRIHGERRYLFRRPRALQYFRGAKLVRSDEERGSGRLELFFDLAFVGILSVLAKECIANPTGNGLVLYLLTFTAAYTIWNWMREMFNAFYKDDLSQRMLVLFVMACLVVYGNNAIEAQQNLEEGTARAISVACFLLAEFAIYGTWLFYSFYVHAFRTQLRAHCLIWLVSMPLMIGSIFVSVRAAIAMIVVALVWEWWAWIFIYSKYFKSWLKLKYSSAVALEHEIERYQDFFTIVMGEFVFSLFKGNPTQVGLHSSTGRAIMALVLAISFQLYYISGSQAKKLTHPLRHSMGRAITWLSLHLPVVCSLTLCGDAMADFVMETHVESGVRWMACGSFALGSIGLWILAMLEEDRDAPGELWLSKRWRLAPRLLTGIIAALLPLTHQREPSETPTETEPLSAVLNTLAEHGEGVAEEFTGTDMTTTKLLGVLTLLVCVTLSWELLTSLDGPNAPHEEAEDALIREISGDGELHASLKTPRWKGYPTMFEPGLGSLNPSSLRHGIRSEDETATQA